MKVIPKIRIKQAEKLKKDLEKVEVQFEAIKITDKTKEQQLTDKPLLKQKIVKEEDKLYLIESVEKHFVTEKGNQVDQSSNSKIELLEGDYLLKVKEGYQLANGEMEEVKE